MASDAFITGNVRPVRWADRFLALRLKHDAELLEEVERQIVREEQASREAIAKAFGRPVK